jgi:hypothetical protein
MTENHERPDGRVDLEESAMQTDHRWQLLPL